MNTRNVFTASKKVFWSNLFKSMCLVCCLGALVACQQVMSPTPPLPEGLSIGVMPVKQATMTIDLLAGNIPDMQGMATLKDLQAFDVMFTQSLRSTSDRQYRFMPAPAPQLNLTDQRSALRKLLDQAQDLGLDMLIVPIITSWTERQGGAAGVVSSAELTMDIFLIDVSEERILKRAHFSEKQESLTSNLLNAPSFFKRGGKWLTVLELAQEAALESIKDFGL